MNKNVSPSFSENVPLKDFCTFGIGGPARYFLEVRTIEEMEQSLSFCHSEGLPYFLLGKGSNCLFDDRGFNGAVLLNKIEFFEQGHSGTFHVGAGYSFALLGVQTARQGWGGLQFASGIPASVGGAVFMNAGANGGETSQFLSAVDYVSEEGKLERLTKEVLPYSYRSSPFQTMKGAIVGATFTLQPNIQAREQQLAIVNYRKKTQPYSCKSAGCVFLNPSNGSAGSLIEQCGLKGLTIGGAQVSPLHANFLVNHKEATCREMLELIATVKKRVKDHTGIDLKIEVRYIPFDERISG